MVIHQTIKSIQNIFYIKNSINTSGRIKKRNFGELPQHNNPLKMIIFFPTKTYCLKLKKLPIWTTFI